MCNTDTTANDLGLTEKNSACMCSSHPADHHGSASATGATGATAATAATSTEYLVSGMTCSHCVSSVTEELSTLDGVSSVSIDLNVGGASTVTVGSASQLEIGAVRAAVSEAGYELVSPTQ